VPPARSGHVKGEHITPRSNVQLIAALVFGVAIGAALALLGSDRMSGVRRVASRAASPDKSLVAIAVDVRCGGERCQDLGLGSSDEGADVLTRLTNQSCDQIVWTPDGKRVAFVIDGREMLLYDAQARKLAGTVRLLSSEAAQSRIARGVTFSENGRAVTFDDCPRAHSGCRAGVLGIPQ
jgi:hypothetical protein